ncbi:unnamed protein product [Dicrocoelium dendriticum]|nr:unnamed protein product [Dicrocoelium dendriticum]
MFLVTALIFSCVFSVARCCSEFDHRTVLFTSKENVLSSKTIVLVEGEAKCRTKDSNELYAELNGILTPVGRDPATGNFQVTFVFEHKDLPPGEYSVRFFNEDSATSYRRLRFSDEKNSVHPVFSVPFRHKGISTTPWVHSETTALLGISTLTLAAFITRKNHF